MITFLLIISNFLSISLSLYYYQDESYPPTTGTGASSADENTTATTLFKPTPPHAPPPAGPKPPSSNSTTTSIINSTTPDIEDANATTTNTAAAMTTTTVPGAPWMRPTSGMGGTGSGYPYYSNMNRTTSHLTGAVVGGNPTAVAMATAATGSSTFNYNDMYNAYGSATISNTNTSTATGANLGVYAYSNTTTTTTTNNNNGPNMHTLPNNNNNPNNKQSGYRKYNKNNTQNILGLGSGNASSKTNELPENERCTLLCTGIPTYIKEDDIMAHFRSFGRVVQLQVTSSASADTSTATSITAATDEATTAASSTIDKDKKTYNECLVQFSTADEAKKCYSSPTAVLNNRFIRISQSNFNIIPPADVPPPTESELLELEHIQKSAHQTKLALQNPRIGSGSGASNNLLTSTSNSYLSTTRQPRAPRPVLGKPAKNKKYIAGVTPITTPITTPIATTSTATTTTATAITSDSEAQVIEGAGSNSSSKDNNLDNIDNDALNTSTTSITASITNNDNDTKTTPTPVSTTTTSTTPTTVTAAAPTKQDLALQQQYEDLRKLRSQVDSIWKTKQNLIQSQIDKCREIIAKIEASNDADTKRDTVEELEGKIVNLQSQLRSLQEQRVTGW